MVYLQKKKLDKARIELSKALQMDPEAYFRTNVNLSREAEQRQKELLHRPPAWHRKDAPTGH